jgi:hypothetical protein
VVVSGLVLSFASYSIVHPELYFLYPLFVMVKVSAETALVTGVDYRSKKTHAIVLHKPTFFNTVTAVVQRTNHVLVGDQCTHQKFASMVGGCLPMGSARVMGFSRAEILNDQRSILVEYEIDTAILLVVRETSCHTLRTPSPTPP